MQRFIQLHMVAVLMIAAIFAPRGQAANETCASALAVRHPLVYRLRDSDRTSRLLVIATTGVSLKDMPAGVHRVLDDADDVVLGTVSPRGLPAFLGSAWFMAKGVRLRQPPLSTLLTRAQYLTLLTRLREVERLDKMVERLTVFAAVALINPFLPKFDRLQKIGNLNEELRARFAGKSLSTLDSTMRQAKVFKTAATIEVLRQLLDDPVAFDVDEFLRRYRAGDEQGLIELQTQEKNSAPSLYAAVVTDVNREWLPAIIAHHRKPGRHLFALTVDHVLGDDGLIQWLRTVGFTVERESIDESSAS